MRERERGRKAAKKKRNALLKPALFFGIAIAVLVGVLLAPTPERAVNSGIQLYGEDPEVEVFGPELPKSTVGSYPVPVVESVVLPEKEDADEEVTYVYASDDQKCYHVETCKYAFNTGHRVTVYEAKLMGFVPCNICNPPTE